MTEYKMLTLTFLELIDIFEVLAYYPFIEMHNRAWTVETIQNNQILYNALFRFTIEHLNDGLNDEVINRWSKKPIDRVAVNIHVLKITPSHILMAPEKWAPGLWSEAIETVYDNFNPDKTLYLIITDTLYDVMADIVRGDVTAETIVEFQQEADVDEVEFCEDIDANILEFCDTDSIDDMHQKVIAYTSFWIERFNEE